MNVLPQCGENNADSANVCIRCGRVLQVLPPNAAVAVQPGVVVPNYLVFAVLTTVLCCLPTGIPAIIYAAQVNGKLQAGDIPGAEQASKNAKMWCWISLGAGLLVMFGYVAFIALTILHHHR